MQKKDLQKPIGGLNTDDNPASLPQGDYSDALNMRISSSDEQHGAGLAETLQGEIELLIGVAGEFLYYGGAIGGEFIYEGYPEIQIGSQVWMKKNWDANYPGSKTYNNDETKVSEYGRLYTQNQALSADFCPLGWKLPTEVDIDQLLAELGGIVIAGGKMKEVGYDHWTTPNTGANDISGFRGLPGGKFNSIFELLGLTGFFWLSDSGSPGAPLALAAESIHSTSFTAIWQAEDGADGYYLDVAEDAGFTNLDVASALSQIVDGLTEGTAYFYRVRAYNDVGTSLNSNTITLTTWTVPGPDGTGLITIDVPGEGFQSIFGFPLCHGSLLYNGYIYGSARNDIFGSPVPGGVIVRVAEDDYSDVSLLRIRYFDEDDTSTITYLEQLQRIGDFLYCMGTANYSDPDDPGDIGFRNVIIRIDTTDFSYKIFNMGFSIGYFSGTPMIGDATHLYVPTTSRVYKYLATDFDNPAWTQFNTEDYPAGVAIAPVANFNYSAQGGNNKPVHSGIVDATHLYLTFNDTYTDQSWFMKVDKATMLFVAKVAVPVCSDDIPDSGTHIFLGVETGAGDYGETWGCIAIRKADLNLTALKKHSTEPASKSSYGVYLYNVGGTDYLFDLRTDGRINIIDITNVDIWDGSVVSDPETVKLLSFEYTDLGVHPVANELLLGTDDILHAFLWSTVTELQKFKMA